jgi:prepilin-type N-terminal cleavage/methylation domain-containing protein
MSKDSRATERESVLPSSRLGGADDGFSLVEVMTALIVFALVSAGALTLVLRAAGTIRGNQDRVLAAAIAASELDRLRDLGSSAVDLGRSTRTEITDSGEFTVTTDATWVSLGVQTDPCDVGDGVDVDQSYLRIHVEVTGGDIDAPQTTDTLLYPQDLAPSRGVGTMTVQVSDSAGVPLADVAVTGTDGAGNSFSQVTGTEGCVFVPDLPSGTNWQVGVARSGYRTESPGGEQKAGVAVDALANTDLAFTIEQPGSFTVTAGSADFPLPEGTAFTYQRGADSITAGAGTTFPAVVSDLWPDQYIAWLGSCPLITADSAANIVVAAGGAVSAPLPAAAVEFVAEAGTVITLTSLDAGCDAQYTLSPAGEDFLVRSAVPFGTWRASVDPAAAPGAQTFFVDETVTPCSVSWSVPSAAAAEPSPSPTESPSVTPSPTSTETPAPSPTLPVVSDQCPPEKPAS